MDHLLVIDWMRVLSGDFLSDVFLLYGLSYMVLQDTVWRRFRVDERRYFHQTLFILDTVTVTRKVFFICLEVLAKTKKKKKILIISSMQYRNPSLVFPSRGELLHPSKKK